MRELVYLSERKLRQFHADRRPWWQRVRELSVRGPLSSGEVRVALSEEMSSRYPDLATVLKYIDRSDRTPKWWEDGRFNPGDWVHFECRLAYELIPIDARSDGQLMDIVIFWEPDFATRNLGKRDRTMLLHGSAEHLMGGIREFAHEGSWRLGGTAPPAFLAFLHRADEGDKVAKVHVSRILTREIRTLVYERLGEIALQGSPPELATWMAGYARVTVDLGDVLAGSPLYVEVVSSPEQDR